MVNPFFLRILSGFIACVITIFVTGCQEKKEMGTPPTSTSTTEKKTLEEAVFLCYADAVFIGTEHRTTQKIDGKALQIRDISELNLNRHGNQVTAKVTHSETLDHSGNLTQFTTKIEMGGQPMTYEGSFPTGATRFCEVEENEKNDKIIGKKRIKIALPVTVSSQGTRQSQVLEQVLIIPENMSHNENENPGEIPVHGGYGLETSLLLNPIQTGEKRQIFRLNPTMLKWETVEMTCFAPETVALPCGPFSMYRVETVAKLLEPDGRVSEMGEQRETLWCDQKGYIWMRFSPLMNLASVRTTPTDLARYKKENHYPSAPTGGRWNAQNSQNTQKTPENEAIFNFAEHLSVPLGFDTAILPQEGSVTAILPKLSGATEITYLVSSITSENSLRTKISGIFEPSDFQKVEAVDDYTVRITVRSSDTQRFVYKNMQSTQNVQPDDLLPGMMIQSDAPKILALAQKVQPISSVGAIKASTSVALGTALESFVYHYIHNKNYARGFVTALEVAENPSGDCTEHAVLMAALARARQVPARIAQGLIYETKSQKMAWHVWNELYLDGHWMPFDATLGNSRVGADHIRINAGSFANATLAQTLIPAAQLIGKIEIHVEKIHSTP